MKKRIMSLLIVFSMALSIVSVTAEIAPPLGIAAEDGDMIEMYYYNRNICDDELANMVEYGRIPQNTTHLHLQNNLITDLTPLYSLEYLSYVDLSINPLSLEKINSLKSALPDAHVYYGESLTCECCGDYGYQIRAGKAELIRYYGTDASITIPDTYQGYPVVILPNAFSKRIHLETITFNKSNPQLYTAYTPSQPAKVAQPEQVIPAYYKKEFVEYEYQFWLSPEGETYVIGHNAIYSEVYIPEERIPAQPARDAVPEGPSNGYSPKMFDGAVNLTVYVPAHAINAYKWLFSNYNYSILADPDPAYILGRIRDNDIPISISDALQILMFLAKIPQSIIFTDTRAKSASLIVNPDADEPTISDLLHVLMYLAKIKSSKLFY